MPYKSDKQRRYMHWAEGQGKIKASVVKDFDKASKGLKLPETAKKNASLVDTLRKMAEAEETASQEHESQGHKEHSMWPTGVGAALGAPIGAIGGMFGGAALGGHGWKGLAAGTALGAAGGAGLGHYFGGGESDSSLAGATGGGGAGALVGGMAGAPLGAYLVTRGMKIRPRGGPSMLPLALGLGGLGGGILGGLGGTALGGGAGALAGHELAKEASLSDYLEKIAGMPFRPAGSMARQIGRVAERATRASAILEKHSDPAWKSMGLLGMQKRLKDQAAAGKSIGTWRKGAQVSYLEKIAEPHEQKEATLKDFLVGSPAQHKGWAKAHGAAAKKNKGKKGNLLRGSSKQHSSWAAAHKQKAKSLKSGK